MPSFGSPFSGLSSERKLTHEELIRAVRFLVASEYEATQMYMQLAESIDHPFAQAVLKDVADEERVHAGQFLKLLHHEKGAKEDDEILKSVEKK
jgi:rubrerythrin